MMVRSCSNTSEYFLRDYVAISMAILRLANFTCDGIMFMRESSPAISLVFNFTNKEA